MRINGVVRIPGGMRIKEDGVILGGMGNHQHNIFRYATLWFDLSGFQELCFLLKLRANVSISFVDHLYIPVFNIHGCFYFNFSAEPEYPAEKDVTDGCIHDNPE